jgi:hypothetical protein
MTAPLHAVAETAAYLAAAKREGLSDEDRTAIVDQIAADPTAGDVVRESGGVRKIRYGGPGGYRVMAAYLGEAIPVFLLSVLAKGSRANFTRDEVHRMRDATKALKAAWKARATSTTERKTR